MKVAIVQSSFLPWRGFFDMMDDVDLMVLFDDVAYSSKTWRSRNRIKTKEGTSWISVPVQHAWPRLTIDETLLDDTKNWRAQIQSKIHRSYRTADHYKTYNEGLFSTLNAPCTTISQLNQGLILWAARALGIQTPLRQARDFAAQSSGEDRVFELLAQTGATSFLNGPTAQAYSTLERYHMANIPLAFKTYDYAPYPQLHGPFEPFVSIIDLLFNCGPDARAHLKSQSANHLATP